MLFYGSTRVATVQKATVSIGKLIVIDKSVANFDSSQQNKTTVPSVCTHPLSYCVSEDLTRVCLARWRAQGCISGAQDASVSVGKNRIKPYIPRIWPYFLNFLASEGNADQFRSKPQLPVLKVREATIEISSAHTDPVVVFVESDCRRNRNVQVAR